MAMKHKQNPPTPIFDNLTYIENPFQRKLFSVDTFFSDSEIITGASLDYEFALKFLYSYNGSSATFNSYRREIERLIQWSWFIHKRSAILLQREDIEDFISFCIDPPITWIGTKNVARFKNHEGERIPNREWRPFISTVSKTEFRSGKTPTEKGFVFSQSAIKAIFTVLGSFYGYMFEEGLTESNPVALIRQKSKYVRKDQNQAIVRRISNLEWDYVLETAELMAVEEPEHERTLFIMNCLFAMYLRISELVADERSFPVMGNFKKDHDGNWWFHVVGKGNKSRTVTVCEDMLKALKRYRQYLGLTPLPTPDDQTPILSKTLGKGPMKSVRHVRVIVQNCFDNAFERMKEDGLEEDAISLRAATVHWLRHTGISEDVKNRPREHVRDDAGHGSMQTTDRYIESDARERHESGKHKPVRELD